MYIDDMKLKKPPHMNHLDYLIRIKRDNQTQELSRRILLVWIALGNLRLLLKVAQQEIEYSLLGLALREHNINIELHRRTRLIYAVRKKLEAKCGYVQGTIRESSTTGGVSKL